MDNFDQINSELEADKKKILVSKKYLVFKLKI